MISPYGSKDTGRKAEAVLQQTEPAAAALGSPMTGCTLILPASCRVVCIVSCTAADSEALLTAAAAATKTRVLTGGSTASVCIAAVTVMIAD